MYTASELERASMALDEPMNGLEHRIMTDIVRRIRENGEITAAADWQITRLVQLGVGMGEIESAIQQALGASDEIMDDLYSKIIVSGYVRDSVLYKAAGKVQIPFEDNEPLQQLIGSVTSQTNETMHNITQSLGFAQRGADGHISFTPLADYYQKTLDNAMLDISSGAFDYNTVLKRTVKEMTNSGLRTVDYATGWSNRVPVAARRAIMTGMNQLTAKVNEQNAEALDTDWFEITVHRGCRPSHLFMQGKWYTKEQLVSVCGLGEATGLCGPNCAHEPVAVIPGISEPSYTDEELEEIIRDETTPKEYNGKEYTTYEALQRQRQLETTMRAQREEVALLKEGGADEDDLINCRARYHGTSHEYAQFSKAMGLPQQRERVSADGLGNIMKGNTEGGSDKESPVKVPAVGAKVTDKVTAEERKELLSRNKVELGSSESKKVTVMSPNESPVEPKYKYVEAKTIEEAQAYGEQFRKDEFMSKTFKSIDYKGISVENANAINRALTDVYNTVDMDKISGIKVVAPNSTIGKKAFKDGADAVFAYDPIQHGIYINKDVLKNEKTFAEYLKRSDDSWNIVMDNIDKLSGSQKELALTYKNAGRELVDGRSIEGLFTHELGHHAQWTLLDADTNNAVGQRMADFAPKLSGYANASKGEYLAESFTAYMKGERDILDPEYVKFIDSKAIDKSAKSGIMNMRKDAAEEEIKWLPKGETISVEEFKELRDYAKSKGVLLQGFKSSDVDIELIRESIDGIAQVTNVFPELKGSERKPLTLSLSDTMRANDFASTDKGISHIIKINGNAFRNSKKLEKEYQKLVDDMWFVQGTNKTSIVKHELGHLYQTVHSLSDDKIIDIAMNSSGINDKKALFRFLSDNLSLYSSRYKDGSEIISEVFSDYFGSKSPTDFSKKFMRELMEMR